MRGYPVGNHVVPLLNERRYDSLGGLVPRTKEEARLLPHERCEPFFELDVEVERPVR